MMKDTHRNQYRRIFQMRFLDRVAQLRPDQHVLDFGCGPLRGGVPLIKYLDRYRYTGIDSRPEAIDEAGRVVETVDTLLDKKPSLIAYTPSTDPFVLELDESLTNGGNFDLIWAFAVLFHLDDDRLRDFYALVEQRLRRGGQCFANVNLGAAAALRKGHTWKGFPVLWRSFDTYRGMATEHGLICHKLHQLKSYGHRLHPADDNQWMLLFIRA